jgi:pimeloyl-ACP methyl ester carboxylesterase
MFTALSVAGVLLVGRVPVVQTKFEQVAPVQAAGVLVRSPGQTRAVALIHGFRIRFSAASVPRADLHGWQRPPSGLVKELARDSDVFAFAYGQDAALEKIASCAGLADAVRRLRQLGYREIVLVGHSAGGVIAREFVEDHPTAGVTKVVQVCCPNGGSPTATLECPRNQKAFLDCLTLEGRQACLRKRQDLHIPERVQFVCLVGIGDGGASDGVVPRACQWTPDLQAQGIPAITAPVSHWEAMRTLRGAQAVAALVRQDEPRWPADRVRKARKEVLGE